MGDQWLKDYEKARRAAQELSRGLEGQAAGNKPEARQAALLRGQLAQVRQNVSHLEQSLMAVSQNTKAYNVTRKELSRRGDLLGALSENVEQLQEAIRTGARRRVEASTEAPWRESCDSRNNGRDCDGGGDQLSGDQELMNQDDALDFLHGTVQTLKGVGSGISQEIDLHCQLLGDVEDQTDNSKARMKFQQSKMHLFSDTSSTTCMWIIIFFLVLILFVLLVFF